MLPPQMSRLPCLAAVAARDACLLRSHFWQDQDSFWQGCRHQLAVAPGGGSTQERSCCQARCCSAGPQIILAQGRLSQARTACQA